MLPVHFKCAKIVRNLYVISLQTIYTPHPPQAALSPAENEFAPLPNGWDPWQKLAFPKCKFPLGDFSSCPPWLATFGTYVTNSTINCKPLQRKCVCVCVWYRAPDVMSLNAEKTYRHQLFR